MYIDAQLPSKLPVKKKYYPSLPVVQYLEEAIQKVLTRAIYEVATVRPIVPFQSPQESALKYISYYLRGL